MLSDHFLVNINVSLQKQSVSANVISYRGYKSIIDKETFLADLRVSSLVLDPPCDLYYSTLKYVVDEHASIRTKEMSRRPMLPWYNQNIHTAKRHRSRYERLWISTTLSVHHKMFSVSKILVKNILPSAKSEYYNKKIKASEIKGLFLLLRIKYYIKVKLSFQITSTQI